MNDALEDIPFAPEDATETLPEPQNTPKPRKKQPLKRTKVGRPFPSPPRSKQKDHTVQPEKFFAYWNGLPKEFDQRQVTYIQREWPVYNYLLGLTPDQREEVQRNPKALRKYVKKYITKYIEKFETDDWRTELLRRHGSGDYKMFLNDSGEGDLKGSTVTKTFVQVRDDEYPPVLDRPELLDLEDPANQSYIESLRMRGLSLPGEAPQNTREEEDDMANVAAIEKLTDALVESSKERNRQPQQPATPDQSSVAAAETMKVISSAAIQGQKIITDAMQTAQQVNAQMQDPMKTTASVIEMAKMLQPNHTPAADPMGPLLIQLLAAERERGQQMVAMQQQMFQMIQKGMEDRLGFMERELQAARAVTAPPAATQPGESDMKLLDKLVSLRDKFDKLTGGNAPDMPGWLPPALQIGEMAIKGATNIMHNLAVLKTGQGQPVPPPELSGEIGAAEVVEEQENDPMKMYLTLIREPLMTALDQGHHGYELAGAILHQYGAGAYSWITQKGQQGILDLLQQDAAMWGEIQKFGAPRVTTFISEFLDESAAQRVAEAIRVAKTNATRPAQPVQPNGAAHPQGRTIIQPDGSKVNAVHRGPAVVKPE